MKRRFKAGSAAARGAGLRVSIGIGFICTMLLALSNVCHSAEGPGFGKMLFSQSDIRFSPKLSPDNKTLSVLFDNLSVELPEQAAVPSVATRTFSLSVPLKDIGTGAMAGIDIHGDFQRQGASGLLVLWVNGRSSTFDLSQTKDSNFVHHVDVSLEKSSECRLIFILMAERDPELEGSRAMLGIESIEVVARPAHKP